MEEKITKEEIKKLQEKDLMFINIPGRMGDISCTLVINDNEKYVFYKIDNMYKYMDILCEIFPIWNNDVMNYEKGLNTSKYKFLDMGMGNYLCIDKEIYDKYITYLLELSQKNDLNYQPSINYKIWKKAINNMINN